MGKSHVCLRHQLCNLRGNLHNLIDAVKHIKNLSASCKFTVHRFAHNFLIVLHHIGLNWQAVHRRLFENAHITNANQAHMQRPGNRGCRQRQHIHILFHLLYLFLMCHAEFVLFIYN